MSLYPIARFHCPARKTKRDTPAVKVSGRCISLVAPGGGSPGPHQMSERLVLAEAGLVGRVLDRPIRTSPTWRVRRRSRSSRPPCGVSSAMAYCPSGFGTSGGCKRAVPRRGRRRPVVDLAEPGMDMHVAELAVALGNIDRAGRRLHLGQRRAEQKVGVDQIRRDARLRASPGCWRSSGWYRRAGPCRPGRRTTAAGGWPCPALLPRLT